MYAPSTRTDSTGTAEEDAGTGGSSLLPARSSARAALTALVAVGSLGGVAQLGCSASRGGAQSQSGAPQSEVSREESRSRPGGRGRRAESRALERASSTAVRAAAAGAREPSDETRAPVDVEIRRTGRSGRVEVLFSFVARRDIPSATLRFAVPEGIDLVQGATEVEFEEVPAGGRRSASATLDVPNEEHFELAAGVDIHLAPNVRLHEGAVVELGAPGEPEFPGRRVEAAGGRDAIRIGPTLPARDAVDVESSSLRVRPERTTAGASTGTDD